MRFEAGSRFAGYTVVSRLGRGGMATVYLVREDGIDRLVALKVLPEQLVDGEQFSTRFEQEARLIGSLDHPNIIPLYRYGITDDVPWMALRYVDGGDFAARLGARPLPVPEGLAILRGVAAALDYAHRKGVIHRDLKPQNILLTGDGAVYLADFGVAKMLEGTSGANTAAGEVLGSPRYMAPEQAQGLRLGPYTDVYALAVICYQWLTGNLPFDADTPHAILLKHIMEPLPTEGLGLLSPNLSSVLERGLAKLPEQRYQSASALIAELEQALYSASTIAIGMPGQAVSSATPLSRPAIAQARAGSGPATAIRSHRQRLFIGVAGLAAALAVGGYLHWRDATHTPATAAVAASATAPLQHATSAMPAPAVSVTPAASPPHPMRAMRASSADMRSTAPPRRGWPAMQNPQALAERSRSNPPVVAGEQSGEALPKTGLSVHLLCPMGTGNGANDSAYLPFWDPGHGKPTCILKRGYLVFRDIGAVRVGRNIFGQALLQLTYKPEAARRLAGLAGMNPGRRVAVVLNGKILAAAAIGAAIHGDEIDVGGLGLIQARTLARRIQQRLHSSESLRQDAL